MQFTRERALILAAATAAFGFSALLRKIAVDKLHPLQFQVIAASVYMTLLPFYIWMAVKHAGQVEWSWKGIGWTILATVVASFGGITFGFALRAGNDAGVVTALSSASPVLTIMLSFLILGERPSLQSAVGCALVLLGIFITVWK